MRTRAWRDDEDEAPMTGWGRVGAASAAEDDGEDGAESDVDAVEAADAFEAKYNFRFEQEGSSQVRGGRPSALPPPPPRCTPCSGA